MSLVLGLGLGSVQANPQVFLQQYCVQCHGEKKPKANLALHNLSPHPVKKGEIETWREIFDRIESGEMPPAGSKQPSSQERFSALADVKSLLKAAGASIDETRLLVPSRGNWVDHDALFSGKPVDPAATRPRLWRVTGQAYEEFMRGLNVQFKLGIKGYGLDRIRAPWELKGQKEFSDYAAIHKIGEADLEYHLRNATRVGKLLAAKFAGNRPSAGFSDWIAELNVVILAGKSANPHQIDAAVEAAFVKILRRPPEPGEKERYGEFFKKCLGELGGERGAEQFLTALLLDPQVLYRVELPAEEGKRSLLPPRSLARAISLALTDNEPDPLLIQAAESGKLASAGDVRAQVERLLRDEQIRKPRILRFFQEYFGYGAAMDIFKDESTLAEHGIARNGWMPRHFISDADHLILWILDQDRDVLKELLTTPKTFLLTAETKGGKKLQKTAFKTPAVQNTLSIYELPIDPEEWSDRKPYDMPADHRFGLLTHPSWLAAHSTNFDNHAIDRGRWIREKLLGGRIPEIPITVDATLPDEPEKPLRERMRVTQAEYCWQCHKQMDPLGFPFEQYDHFGRYRTAELVVDKEATEKRKAGKLGARVMKTVPLNVTGMIENSGDPKLDGPVQNLREFMHKLASSQRVEEVFVRHVFRFFVGRNETLADGPTLVAAHRAYKEAGGSFKALVVSLLTSDSFLYRSKQ